MANHAYTELVILSILQECIIQLEQQASLGLKLFSEYVQGKSSWELIDIKLHILQMMQRNYQSPIFVSFYQQMIVMVDEQIAKQKK